MDAVEVEFWENNHGTHAVIGEQTICGFAIDAPDTESADDAAGLGGSMFPAVVHVVTCPKCAEIARAVKLIRVRKAA